MIQPVEYDESSDKLTSEAMIRSRTTAVEKLNAQLAELKEKQSKLLERKKLIEATQDAAEKKRTRKAENNRKYEFGGLVKIAGLFEWDKGQFLGALLRLKELAADESVLGDFKRRGDSLLKDREGARKAKQQTTFEQ